MIAPGHGRAYTTKALRVRFGRKATKHVRTLFDRFWLKAAELEPIGNVGFLQ